MLNLHKKVYETLASVLILLFNLDLCRAALFLWISPRFTIESMTGTAARYDSFAATASPSVICDSTRLMNVRYLERCVEFLCRRDSA